MCTYSILAWEYCHMRAPHLWITMQWTGWHCELVYVGRGYCLLFSAWWESQSVSALLYLSFSIQAFKGGRLFSLRGGCAWSIVKSIAGNLLPVPRSPTCQEHLAFLTQLSSGPVKLLKITLECSIDSQNIWRRVVDRVFEPFNTVNRQMISQHQWYIW